MLDYERRLEYEHESTFGKTAEAKRFFTLSLARTDQYMDDLF